MFFFNCPESKIGQNFNEFYFFFLYMIVIPGHVGESKLHSVEMPRPIFIFAFLVHNCGNSTSCLFTYQYLKGPPDLWIFFSVRDSNEGQNLAKSDWLIVIIINLVTGNCLICFRIFTF